MSDHKISPGTPAPRTRLAAVFLMLALLCALPACESADSGEGSEEDTTVEVVEVPSSEDAGEGEAIETVEPVIDDMESWPTPPPPPPAAERMGRGSSPDRGDFVPRYVPPSNPNYAEIHRIFREARILEDIAGVLNRNFALPHDVPMDFRECGEPNAYYDPATKEIHMCYEFVAFVAQLNMEHGASREEAVQGMKGALYFTFYHEIGHALVDVLDLPVTGQQEELADELSAFVLTNSGGPEGETLVLNGAKFWLLLANARKKAGAQNSPWDEHLTDEQRFFNLTCFLYGSNPSKHGYLVPNMLPPPRAAKCPSDYARLVKGWVHALGPFLKS